MGKLTNSRILEQFENLPDILATFHGKNVDKTFLLYSYRPRGGSVRSVVLHKCLEHCLLSLSPPQRPLYVARRLGERKRESTGHDGKGEEREERPLPIVPLLPILGYPTQ